MRSLHPVVFIRSSRQGQISTAKVVFINFGVVAASIALMSLAATMILWPAVEQARTAAKRSYSKNNLKQIGLAFHNFHNDYESLPSGIAGSEVGNPQQSWMTNLLPFLEGGRNLFDAIDKDKGWTAPENQEVFKTVVYYYVSPLAKAEERKIGNFGAAHYAGNSHLLGPSKEFKLSQIKDGTSNTFLAGEVASGFNAWGNPGNVRDPADGIGQLANQFGCNIDTGMTLMMLADGSVRAISTSIDKETLRALATPAGKESIEDSKGR